LNDRQRRFAEVVRSSADSLLHLLNDILDFSKIEAGRLDLERSPYRPREVIADVIDMFSGRARAKGLALDASVDATVPESLWGDPYRVRQILVNLVGNALKFTERGEVAVRASLETPPDDQAPMLKIEVRDSGIGISRDAQSRLFRSFSQADSSTTRRFGGSGLGLAIVRELVQMMHGRIGLSSVPGRGTTFWFLTPAEAAPDPEASTHADPRLAGKRVLLVEDDATNRAILLDQLDRAGFAVSAAADGDTALTLLRTAAAQDQAFELAVVDMRMPVMDGAALALEISRDASIAATRIVILSSMYDEARAELATRSGVAGYLLKPVRRDELYRALARAAGLTDTAPTAKSPAIDRRFDGVRVLLAEDNDVNREIAVSVLESLGCEVAIARDGAEALARFRAAAPDFVLMDCQMPVMDGYEATRQIRDFESLGVGRVPVVALTADVVQGARERSLEAGMDDHITKPFSRRDIAVCMERWLSKSVVLGAAATPRATSGSATQSAAADSAALDLSALQQLQGMQTADGTDLIAKIVHMFITQTPQLFAGMHAAYAAGNARDLRRAAHTLKSTSATVGATDLSLRAAALEAAADDGGIDHLLESVARLEAEFASVVNALRRAYPEADSSSEVKRGGAH
ncbi:MAG: response regulator, partial [Betaproteobacteria bacterium]|nr:response regulator [Betaproteobacteria bacterium]